MTDWLVLIRRASLSVHPVSFSPQLLRHAIVDHGHGDRNQIVNRHRRVYSVDILDRRGLLLLLIYLWYIVFVHFYRMSTFHKYFMGFTS